MEKLIEIICLRIAFIEDIRNQASNVGLFIPTGDVEDAVYKYVCDLWIDGTIAVEPSRWLVRDICEIYYSDDFKTVDNFTKFCITRYS